MKIPQSFAIILSALFLVGFTPAIADEVVLTHQQQADEITAQYIPQFDFQYSRLMAVRAKALADPIMMKSIKFILADFANVRRIIDTNLANPTSELAAIGPYAEEELGEFEPQIAGLELDVTKLKTITCLKAKTVKKVTGVSPKCPTGYKKK